MSQAKATVVKQIIREIGDSIGEDSMLDACDGSGVMVRGYNAIFRTVKNRIGLVAHGIKSGILPAPHRLATLRKQMNSKLPQFIGDYYHIDGRRTIPEVRVGGKVVTAAKEVVLDSKNNLFVELEVVQHSMVLFYEMTVEGMDCSFYPQVYMLNVMNPIRYALILVLLTALNKIHMSMVCRMQW